MAASLRAAATRILRPAVLPGEGLRRIFHTQQLSKSTRAYEEGHRPSIFTLKEYRASRIQETKEQLYDLIAGAEANSKTFLLNKSLLKDLSTQVKPRPEDPHWCKISRTKKVTDITMSAGILVISGLTYYALTSCPEIVKFGDYLVTAESVPMIRERLQRQVIQERLQRQAVQERLSKQYGYWPVATAEGVDKQDGYQRVATAEGADKQDAYQPVAAAEGAYKRDGYQPVATAEGADKQDGYQRVATAEGADKQDGYQRVATAEREWTQARGNLQKQAE
ncbi:uncharacterized protein [Aegilops tauschii subsp. strangulata]|uniref:Uncharacterized protein n=4 Tax=Aegilops tauschii TaxID=37682 RepID=A0A453A471_AEGTS|nr:uncharacterized protein LOC109782202 [Aegilops tauschii subsp. strangulata]